MARALLITLYRNALQGSCVSKKEPRSLEQGKGSSIIKFWKSLKQTVGLYDVAHGKTMPENVLQHNGISQSSCKSRGVLYNLMRVKTTLHIKMNTEMSSRSSILIL